MHCNRCEVVKASGKKYTKCPYCGHVYAPIEDICSCITLARKGAHNKRERTMVMKNEEASDVIAE
jgi:uncharacterized OB-fold protein